MTPASVEGRISDRTRAILALHIFGVPCDIHGIMNLANRHGIPVVEDCAHSLGSSVSGTSTGCFGSAAFYSFDLIKLINTFGGGMVLMDDAALAARVRSCNQTDPEGFTPVYRKARAARIEQLLFSAGLMYPLLYLLATPALKEGMNRLYRRAQSTLRSAVRYDAPQAQLGLHKLTTLEQRIEMRLRCADVMRSLLHPSIHVQRVPEGCEVCGYAFVVLLPCPAAPVRKQLLLRGIDAAVEGEIMDDCAAALGYDDCPVISDIFPRLLALPMHDRLSEKEAERVARSLNASI